MSLAHDLKTQGCAASIIVWSESAEVSRIVATIKAGADDYIISPPNDTTQLVRVAHNSTHTSQMDVLPAAYVRSIVEIPTGQPEAEQLLSALRESEARFRSLADSSPVLIWMADTTTACVYFNKPWLDFTGRSLEAELGNGWATGVHPDDLDRCLEVYRSAFRARQPFRMEYRLKRADGVYRWLLDNGVPRWTPEGVFTGYIGSCVDIHELKMAQDTQHFLNDAMTVLASSLEEQTTLVNVAHLAVPVIADWCVIDMLQEDGSIRTVALAHANPELTEQGWELMRRYPVRPDNPYGTAFVLRTGQPELVPEVPDDIIDAVAQDQEHARLVRALGLYSSLCVPILVRGQAIGTIALVSAQRKRYGTSDLLLAEELARRVALALENARLYHEARHAITMRDQFLSIASHELKTPLTSLLGYARLLQRRQEREPTLNERDTRALQTIVTQSVRLEGLINLLLDLSRIESGQLQIDTAEIDLKALTERIAEDQRASLDQHTLFVECDSGPILINGDEVRIEQVIQNLLQNAIKYSPNGGTVSVHLSREADQALLAVADQGIGIPAAAMPHLFQRFYRAPNVSPLHISGTGIGLYVVREIVARHSGTIEVQSIEGEGSTFRVRLPLVSVPTNASGRRTA